MRKWIAAAALSAAVAGVNLIQPAFWAQAAPGGAGDEDRAPDDSAAAKERVLQFDDGPDFRVRVGETFHVTKSTTQPPAFSEVTVEGDALEFVDAGDDFMRFRAVGRGTASVRGLFTYSDDRSFPFDLQFTVGSAAGARGGRGGGDAPAVAEEHADVPVTRVVLFSSGVGYFEHFGTVTGDATAQLTFRAPQVNDLLKSLVLQDIDGGTVGTVTYPSLHPVARTLASFQLDITGNPSLADLLVQLRGAVVTVATLQGQEATGTVLGVERRQRPIGRPEGGDPAPGPVVEQAVLNLLTDDGAIRPVDLEQVRDVRIEDAELRAELQKALEAVAQARGQDKRPIVINFRGEGERRVKLGYVVEAPIWKASYRLVLRDERDGRDEGGAEEGDTALKPDAGAAPKAAGDAAKAAGDAAKAPAAGQGGAQPGAGAEDADLQGWAVVENQTDSDWEDVQLSLVSGRPISFIQDLYTPLYVPRPLVQPELYASLRPQTYEGGMDFIAPGEADEFADADRAKDAKADKAEEKAQMKRAGGRRMREAEQMERLADAPAAAETGTGIDPSASVTSVASAAQVGELFQYTVGSVSLPRQQSAMIPIVTEGVQVERLSIYNQAVLPRNPLRGVRLVNSTDSHLPQGPVTVLDQTGGYSGDASLSDLPPGQERLLSYAIDQEVLVDATKNTQEAVVQTGTIVKGVLQVTMKRTFSQDYLAQNKGDDAKTLIIEHPLRQGWTLAAPEKADETTPGLYRFRVRSEPGQPQKLTVREEHVDMQGYAILPLDLGQLQHYAQLGPIPQPVKDALMKAAGMKSALVDIERQITERQQREAEITAEQVRIRENMKTVASGSDLYSRLEKKLGEQETLLEKLQSEVEGLREKLRAQQKELEDYLMNLDVG